MGDLLGLQMLKKRGRVRKIRYVAVGKVEVLVLEKEDWLKVNHSNVNYLYSGNLLPKVSSLFLPLLSRFGTFW